MKSSPLRVLAAKEIRVFLSSPVAPLAGVLFLLLSGWFFISPFFLNDRADMRDFFTLLPLLFAVIVPALTMGLFSAEYHSGHFEILGTLPLTAGQIILGKYYSALTSLGILLIPTLSYPLFISSLGDLDWGPVWGGYAGALLLGSSYAAIGLLFSSLTKSQVSAFLSALGVCLFLALTDDMAYFLPPTARELLSSLGTDSHFENFTGGLIDFRDILYFLSLDAAALLLIREVFNERS